MNLKGKTVLITGGALRIGRSICQKLAAAGANVVVHYRSSAQEARALVAELQAAGVESLALPADFREPGACAGLIEAARMEAGGLDCLVNSAAVYHRDTLASLDAAKLRSEMEVNLEAPTLLMQAFAQQCTGGRIVNILDRRVAGDDIECIPYLLSKKALAAMTRLAALALAPAFTVNAVAPGDVLPPSGDNAKDYAAAAPLDADCSPGHVAEAVVFLLKMDVVTGQVVFVDAGAHLV